MQYYFKVFSLVELLKPIQIFKPTRCLVEKKDIKFPYSILLAGIGVMFAIIAWMLSIAMYCKLPKQRLQSLQDQNLNEEAETSHVVSLDQNMTETSYSAIKESQVQDIKETSKISTSVSQQRSCSPVMF